jgi:hypothetical protein
MRTFVLATAFLFSQLSHGQDAELIGGTVVDPKDWPASPWVGNCSSTIIGEQVLLTAAHCVGNGGTKTFTIGATRYSGTCTHHTSYSSNNTADWALCLLATPVAGIPLESIASASEVDCTAGKKLLWTGYGCTRWGGSIDGKFRTGNVTTTQCPSGTNFDTITRGNVALCSGDSGGGGYIVFEDGTRKVVGVNSRSNTTDTSYVSSTYSPTFTNWAMSWARAKNVKICGLHDDANGCSEGSQNPPSCVSELNAVETAMAALKSDRILTKLANLEEATAVLRSCMEAN